MSFSMRRKDGTGDVGWYKHPKGENSMNVSVFGLVQPGSGIPV